MIGITSQNFSCFHSCPLPPISVLYVAARMILSKCESAHATPLLKSLQWFSINLVPNHHNDLKALHDLVPTISLTSLPTALPLPYLAPAVPQTFHPWFSPEIPTITVPSTCNALFLDVYMTCSLTSFTPLFKYPFHEAFPDHPTDNCKPTHNTALYSINLVLCLSIAFTTI